MRVIAAMSGGVDSAVAAARLAEAGHEVIGVHMALSRDPQSVRVSARGCCSLEDAADARRVCDKLDIPFYVWDFSDEFAAEVIDDFVNSYARGETPNPCLRCNEKIKFHALLKRARALGFDAVATGHYARIQQGYLLRGIDPNKDQSYVLGVLTADDIAHCIFPVGDTYKPEIREEARKRGLSVASKPDSYDICFIPDGNTRAFLGARLGVREGTIVDTNGHVLRSHTGTYGYTIGQRKGLALGDPAPDGQPRYVVDIDPDASRVVVGPRSALSVKSIRADRIKVLHPHMQGTRECEVQVRAHGGIVSCTAHIEPDHFLLDLHSPLTGVAPGQAAVLYDGDIVLGSGTIIR